MAAVTVLALVVSTSETSSEIHIPLLGLFSKIKSVY